MPWQEQAEDFEKLQDLTGLPDFLNLKKKEHVIPLGGKKLGVLNPSDNHPNDILKIILITAHNNWRVKGLLLGLAKEIHLWF